MSTYPEVPTVAAIVVGGMSGSMLNCPIIGDDT